MDIFSQSEQLRQALTPFIQKIVDERTKECLRTYKAKIVNEPNTTTKKCGVQLVGQENILSLPYSEDCRGVSVGDMVWVATTYGSWKNAVVFSKVGFGKSLPKGFVYITLDPTPPDILFGGTWEKIGGRFLIGAGKNIENTTDYWGELQEGLVNMPVGEMGGEYYHKLKVSEMPNHSHYIDVYKDSNNDGTLVGASYSGNSVRVQQSASEGGDQPHINMPPYLVVYMWKRVA